MTKPVKGNNMSDSVNEREVVLDILLEIDKEKNFSHIVIGNALTKYQYLPKVKRKFISRVAKGTIEKKIELDYIINQFSKTPVKKMKPLIRNLLEMSVYQFKYMSSIPASAVCNEAVKLAQKRKFSTLKGFINGVLRNISRNLDGIVYPNKEKEYIKYLSVKYSFPEWILEMWKADYGTDILENILDGFESEKNTYIRCNTNKISVDKLYEKLTNQGINVSFVKTDNKLPCPDYALSINDYDYLSGIDGFEQGEFYVQDLSSMIAGEIAAPEKNYKIIDVCAAPGGKSINLALKQKDCEIIARDISDYKVGLIETNLDRMQIDNIYPEVLDALEYDENDEKSADMVIADLPCSGLGIIGRKPDIKYNVTKDTLKSLSKLQKDILSVVSRYVKNGGYLVYSTCTINKDENDGNVTWITNNLPFELVKDSVQMYPSKDGTDGFFVAKFKRIE